MPVARPVLLLLILGLVGCGPPNPYHKGDVLVSVTDHKILGQVIDTGTHHFPSGVIDESVEVRLDGTAREEWYATNVLSGHFEIQGAAGK